MAYLSKALLVATVSFISFLQFYRLGELPIIQWDESRLAVNAAEMYHSGNYLISTYEGKPDLYNTKPPLMIWAQVMSIHAFGLNEFAIRFPAAMSGLLCIFLCGYIVFQYKRNMFHACLGMLLLACSRGFIQLHGSLTGDYDAMLALFLLIAFHEFYNGFIAPDRPASRTWFAVALAFAIMCKSAAALVSFPIFMLAVIPQINMKKLRLAGLYCLLSLLPFILFCLVRENASAGYLEAIQRNDFGGRFSKALEGHHSEWHYYIVNLFDYRFNYFICLLPAALLMPIFRKDVMYRYFSFVLVAFIFFTSLAKTRIHWYDTPALPLVAITLVLFIESLYAFMRNKYLKLAYICILCLSLVPPVIDKYRFIAVRQGMTLNYSHYELSHMLKNRQVNEHMTYIANPYDAEFLFYTRVNDHIRRGHIDSLHTGDIVAFGNMYKDTVGSRYHYTILDSTQNAWKTRITGIK